MFDFLKYKKTNFVGGGLMMPRTLMADRKVAVKTPQFVAPKKLDFRDMCIQTSDQGQTSKCAAYSTAGNIEVLNWKKMHYPQQVDPDPIYAEAKRLDGNTSDGTSLDHAAQAALNLKLIEGQINFVDTDINSMKFAIHTNTSFVGGFMITDEWNRVNSETGQISDFGDNARKLGGHAILCCGYSDIGLYIQNSWGSSWGIYGFALIPWAQVTKQYMYGVFVA